MTEETPGPTPYVRALVREREGYLLSSETTRVVNVNDELARCGWSVNPAGELVAVDLTVKTEPAPAKKAEARPRKETAAAKPAPERAVPKD